MFGYDWPRLHAALNDLPAGEPRLVQRAEGIAYTIVNGTILLEHGEHTGAYPGRVLRRAG